MKKVCVYILLVFSFVLNSCSKSSQSSSGNQSIPNQISINGQTYEYTGNIGSTEINIAGTGGSAKSCNNINSFIQLGPVFQNSSYLLNLHLYHYQNDKDFKTTKIGDYTIKNDSTNRMSAPCYSNMDLLIDFSDKTVNSNTNNCLMQYSGATNKVVSITQVSSDSGSKTYLVSGTFSCNLVNPNNKTIPITGNYNIYIMTLL